MLSRIGILLVLAALTGVPAAAAEGTPTSSVVAGTSAPTVRVDRRVELLSVLHRLIGHQAYARAPATPYALAVDRTFAPFVDHPAVAATRALRASHSITWDAPMILAVHLDDQFQLVNPEELATLDARFAGADVEGYASLLRDFAQVTGLDDFLAGHRPYIARVEATLRTMIEQEDPVPWFDRFFGAQPKARYLVVPGLLTGPMNYGVRATLPDGTLEITQVLGVYAANGLPLNDDLSVALLVHEMARAYVNPLVATHRAALEAAGTRLFALVEEQMRQQAYDNWTTLVDESIVRAVVALYLWETRGEAAGLAEIAAQERLGFYWTSRLVGHLERYQRERATFNDFAAFLPELVKAFDALAADPAQ